jgi:hypothetical protein
VFATSVEDLWIPLVHTSRAQNTQLHIIAFASLKGYEWRVLRLRRPLVTLPLVGFAVGTTVNEKEYLLLCGVYFHPDAKTSPILKVRDGLLEPLPGSVTVPVSLSGAYQECGRGEFFSRWLGGNWHFTIVSPETSELHVLRVLDGY